MSAEAVVKKRGRPRKSSIITTEASSDRGETKNTTSRKQSTKTNFINTAESMTREDTVPVKKTSRRKKVAVVDEIYPSSGHSDFNVVPAKADLSNPSHQVVRSQILDEAKAFQKLKSSAAAQTKRSVVESGQFTSSTDSTSVPPNPSPTSTTPEAYVSQNATVSPSGSSPTGIFPSIAPSTTPKDESSRSSFLSSFLSDAEVPPIEPDESAKVIDRSAFNAQNISIDEIVSGIGVSDLATLTATKPQTTARPERKSAIPITAPRTFKSHNVAAFPDKRQQPEPKAAPPRNYVNPETYTAGSFKSFKTTTSPSPHVPPTPNMSPNQPTTNPQHQQKATLQTSSAPSSSPTPPQQQARPSTSTLTPASPTTPTTTNATPSTTLKPSHTPQTLTKPISPNTPPTLRPKRPTEMTPAELLKNPHFKSLRRKYTGIIVGIPVLVVTSYLLWKRMDMSDEVGRWVGGKEDTSGDGEGRVRGQMPRRILDDGGLERR